MHYRKLGKTGLEVSEIGYGAWGIGGGQWQGHTDDESRESLRRALELGVNLIDSALAYNEGHSERLIAEVLRETSHKAFLATKVPPKNRIWPAPKGIPLEEVFPYDYIVACTETSLRNFGVERIDLQQLHVWDPGWLDRDEWKRAFEDLKRAGKIRAVGVSINDHQPDSAISAVESGFIDTVQVIYNIFDQTSEESLFPAVQKHDVGVLARVPLDEGALTGNITEDSTFAGDEFRAEYFRGDRRKQVVEHVDKLRQDLTGVAGTLPEIALQFCLSHPAVSCVIPGMRRVRNVESNASVSERGSLDASTLAKLKKHAWNKNFYD